MMRKILGLISCLLTLAPLNATAMIDLNRYSEKLYVPIAKIEDQTLTEQDLQQKMAILRMSGISIKRNEAIENLIDQEILLYTHRDRKVSQDAIDITLKRLITENNLTEDAFKKVLQKFSIDISYLEKHIAAQLILNDMVISKVKDASQTQRILYQKTSITQEEIKKNDKFFSQPIIDYTFSVQSQVKIAEMIVKKSKNLESIISLLKQGVEFSKIHNQFPNEVELQTMNGLVGWLSFNDMSDLYKEVIQQIKVGEIGGPLVADDKLLFIKLLDMQDVKQSQRYLNPEYRKLSFKEKSDHLFNKTYAHLISSSILDQLKKQLYIEIL